MENQSLKPQTPLPSSSIPQQINTEKSFPSVQIGAKKPKRKFKIIFIIFGLFVFLVLGYFAANHFLKEYSTKQKSPEQLVSYNGREEMGAKQESEISGWKINECIHEGYKISYPEDMTPHNIFPQDNSCASQYGYSMLEEPIFIGSSNTKISADEDHIINSEKEITINGIKARYLEMKINRDLEMKKFLVYEYPGNGKYYHLYLNLDYHNTLEDLDFYKDTQWDEMIDEINKSRDPTNFNQYTMDDIENIFHEMAQTFELTVPKTIPVSDLEACLNTAQENQRDNEKKIRKPTGNPNEYSISREDSHAIYLQYITETNLCYRKYKEEGMEDCYQQYPNDADKEYECNFYNIEPVLGQ